MHLVERLRSLNCINLIHAVTHDDAESLIHQDSTFRQMSVVAVISRFSDEGLKTLEAYVSARKETPLTPFTVAKKYLVNMEIKENDARLLPRYQDSTYKDYRVYWEKLVAASML